MDRNGYNCIGKPEALSGNLAGYWSVRIDEKNRIVFRINENSIEILQCGTHYRDK
ncbi:MAG: type II toxin-antitoxin system YoeB family toxin [[Clostridium] innocuum]